MSRIRCFFLEPSDEAQETLRRFVWACDARCYKNPSGYHNTVVAIGNVPWTSKETDGSSTNPTSELKQSLLWPKMCECGYLYQEDDEWQHSLTRLYRRKDNGDLHTLPAAPTGAMWYANWLRMRRKEGQENYLVVKTPGGDWCVDGPSTNGSGWHRSGEPPDVTAHPSILIGEVRNGEGRLLAPGYHGWLRGGYLEEA